MICTKRHQPISWSLIFSSRPKYTLVLLTVCYQNGTFEFTCLIVRYPEGWKNSRKCCLQLPWDYTGNNWEETWSKCGKLRVLIRDIIAIGAKRPLCLVWLPVVIFFCIVFGCANHLAPFPITDQMVSLWPTMGSILICRKKKLQNANQKPDFR